MYGAPLAVVGGEGDATSSAVVRRFTRESFPLCVTERNVEKLSSLFSDIGTASGIVKALT